MATVDIRLSTGNGDFDISLEAWETNGEAWGSDKTHLDALVDEAVRRVKRAYGSTQGGSNGAHNG